MPVTALVTPGPLVTMQTPTFCDEREYASAACGGLLMADQDMLEFVLLENRVVDVKHRAAGVAENVFHAFFGQAAHDDIGAIQFHVVIPFKTGPANPACCPPGYGGN